MIWWALASAALTIVMAIVRKTVTLPPAAQIVSALLPVVVMVGFFVGMVRYLRSLDELQRLIHLEALLFQFAGTALLVMAYGSLAGIAVVRTLSVSDAMSMIWIGTFLLYGLGLFVVGRRYR